MWTSMTQMKEIFIDKARSGLVELAAFWQSKELQANQKTELMRGFPEQPLSFDIIDAIQHNTATILYWMGKQGFPLKDHHNQTIYHVAAIFKPRLISELLKVIPKTMLDPGEQDNMPGSTTPRAAWWYAICSGPKKTEERKEAVASLLSYHATVDGQSLFSTMLQQIDHSFRCFMREFLSDRLNNQASQVQFIKAELKKHQLFIESNLKDSPLYIEINASLDPQIRSSLPSIENQEKGIGMYVRKLLEVFDFEGMCSTYLKSFLDKEKLPSAQEEGNHVMGSFALKIAAELSYGDLARFSSTCKYVNLVTKPVLNAGAALYK